MHRDLNMMLTATIDEGEQDSWEDVLPAALFALQTTTSMSTGLTPYYILFGRDVSCPLDFKSPAEAPQPTSQPIQYVKQLKDNILQAQAFCRRNLAEAVRLSLIHI